jgi:hypothetical protein
MPYSVNNTDSSLNFTVTDGAIDNSTLSISLIGTNAENYADDIARNDVHLLENFASTSAPTAGTVLTGQLWYDKTDNVLRVYNGTQNGWVNLQPLVLGTAPVGTGARTNKKGELYFDTSNNKFYIFDGATWKPTGYGGEVTSELSGNADVNNPTKFGSKVRSIFLKDTSGVPRPCLALIFVNDSTTNEFYGAGTNGETIMAIFNHTTTFTADNVSSETEGENINYYAELNATGSVGTTINKGMNLRKDYVAEAVSLATEAITAQKANALFRSGQVVDAGSILTKEISWIPEGTTGTLTLGNETQYFDSIYVQRIKFPNDGNNQQAEIETFADNKGLLGSQAKAFADVHTYDVHAKANISAGEILSVTGNSNLIGNVDITNNLQVDKNITSDQIIKGATFTDNVLQINSGSISSAINGAFSGRVTFGDLFDGSISITQFDSATGLGTNNDRVPTQGAVKTYVDTANANMKTYVDIQDNAQDLDIATDSGTIDILVNSETLTIAGGDGIGSTGSGTTATLNVDNTVVRTSGAQSIAGVKTFSDNAIFSGNLTVNGTQTTVNSATLSIADNKITLNSDYTGSGPSENAGIEVERGTVNNAVLRWNESTDKWQFTNDGGTSYSDITSYGNFSVTSASASGNGALSYNNSTGVFTFTPADTSLSTKSTTNLSEGTNKYFTDARADARIGAADLSALNNVATTAPTSNQVLQWNGSAWAPATTAAGVTDINDLGDVFTGGATTGQVLQKAANGNFNFGSVSTTNNYADSLTFATGTGVLTVGRSGLGDLTVDLDGRYSTTDTQYSVATSSTAGLVKIGFAESGKNYPVELSSDKMFVNVPWTDTSYSLPLSSSSTRGGVKIGYAENGKNYPVELSSEKMFVNVPWTDSTGTDTTYTAGGGLTLSGTEFSLTAVTEATNVTAVSRRYLNSITLDGYGRVTGVGTASEGDQPVPNYYVNSASFNSTNGELTLTRSDSGTVVVDLDGRYITTDTNTTYSTATSSTLGLVKIGYSESGKNYPVELSSGKMYVNVPWTDTVTTDTNTTYTGGNGLTLNGTTFDVNGSFGSVNIQTTGNINGSTVSGNNGEFNVVRSSGDVIAYYSSDERLKDNVKPIENALEKLQKIRGVEFDWNDKQDVYQGHDTGVIAQEVQKVLPEVVTEREDGYLAVKYEKMIGLLVESIKDLKAEVDELKTQLNEK